MHLNSIDLLATYWRLMGDLCVTYGRPLGDLWATYGEDTVEEWDIAGIYRKVAYRICVYCVSDLRIWKGVTTFAR
ncbi:MAG: hypothetical protein IJ621_07165 [Paludibacteraceae bacterium]|nr:hypothetical protein [Paludibacteraceae bacterium]